MNTSPSKDAGHATEVAEVKNLSIGIRLSREKLVEGLRPEDFLLFDRTKIQAWRLPACYKEQSNLPGYFWVSQTKQFIFYESRLEMTILKHLDFEETFDYVLAQPVQLSFEINGKLRKHVPDFLIWRRFGKPLLINVKPQRFVNDSHSIESFAACNELCRIIQIEHRIRSELTKVEHTNLRWLAGYRRIPHMYDDISQLLESRLLEKGSLSFSMWIQDIGEEALVRPVAFHMMWLKRVSFDGDVVIGTETLISLPN